jgi:hypothetical protein
MQRQSTRRQAAIDGLPIALAGHLWFDGASKETLYRMAKRGDLKLTKVGRRTFVLRLDAERAQKLRPRFIPVVL